MKCPYCKRRKPAPGRKHCNTCLAYFRKWNQEHRPQRTAAMRDKRAKSPLVFLVREAKGRARVKGLPFDITPSDLEIPTHCPLLGIQLEPNRGGKQAQAGSPTIDRINPALGYVRGNVWVVSYRANRIKHNASLEELEVLTANLRKRMAA
jgi:hypothetical protein